jgi:hypothetical protein
LKKGLTVGLQRESGHRLVVVASIVDGEEGVDFVRCRICDDHRRVISGRHLSKHDTNRATYMEEYHLTPDELIAKDFRMIRSSRRGFYPHGKSDWIDAGKRLHKPA